MAGWFGGPRETASGLQTPLSKKEEDRIRTGLAKLSAADRRLAQLRQQGQDGAQLYGRDASGPYGGLNAFFLLMDKPEVYGLPTGASTGLPSRNNAGGYVGTVIAAVLAVLGGLVAFRRRREAPSDPSGHLPLREGEKAPAGGQ